MLGGVRPIVKSDGRTMAMRPWILGLCSLSVALSGGCAERELEHVGALLTLTDRLEVSTLELGTPTETPAALEEVLWVREGLAAVVVGLKKADAIRGGEQAYRRWQLPLPAAPAPFGGEGQPELLGMKLALHDPDAAGRPALAFWVQGRELAITKGMDKALPQDMRLRYVVHAAHLAGTAQAAGVSTGDLLGIRLDRGASSSVAIAIPTGSTLSIPLPPLPTGKLAGAFSSLSGIAGAGAPEVFLRLGGEEVFRDVVIDGAEPIPIGTSARPFIEMPDSLQGRVLEVEVTAGPGGIVFFEAPIWSRPRSWRDDSNVLLVVIDSLRADRVGVYGNRAELTPNLDRFAQDALRFDQAWAAAPWTLPSMATILTSTHGIQHRAWLPSRRLGDDHDTLAEVFKEQGYRTAAFADGDYMTPARGFDRGFHTFEGGVGGIEELVDRFLAFVERTDGGPWFVVLHTNEAHGPYDPPEEAREAVLRRHPDVLEGRPADPDVLTREAEDGVLPPPLVTLLEELYDEEVRYTDEVLGVLLGDLRTRGLYDDAVICITSDHGEALGEHLTVGHGSSLFTEQLHVPLLLKFSGGERGSVVINDPVSQLDLAPTLLQAVGLDVALSRTTFSGKPLTGGKTSAVYSWRYVQGTGLLEAVRLGDHVMISGDESLRRGARLPELGLYNLREDPTQTDEARATKSSRTAQAMRRIRETLHAKFDPPKDEGAEADKDQGLALRYGKRAAPRVKGRGQSARNR